MRSCIAKMKFADVTALKDGVVTLNENQSFSKNTIFYEQASQRDYATLERNQFVLDGTKDVLSEEPEDVGFWSIEKSDEQCRFEVISSVIVQFTEPHSSAGITLYFAGKPPVSVRIKWMTLEGSVIDSKVFYPNSSIFVCRNMVQNYGGLTVEVLETQFPDSYARIQFILYGLELIWDEGVIKNAKITEASDVTAATLPENKATVEIIDESNDFDIENEGGTWKAVQNSQEVCFIADIDGNEYSEGVFYIKDFSFKKNIASFNMVNSVGFLDNQLFYGGEIYVNEKAGKILDSIFAEAGFEKYEIAEEVYNTEVSGYLPIKSCRESIKVICFACGAIANDGKDGILRIYHPDRYVKHVVGTDRKVMGETVVSLETFVSGVSIECCRYNLSGDISEIYNDTLKLGTTRITFSMPFDATTVTVEGGTCVRVTTNYVDVFMQEEGNCVVKGKAYEEKTFSYQKSVDLLPAGTKENVKKFGKCTIYNAEKLPDIAKRLLDYYSLQKTLKMRYFMESECAGEWLNVKNLNGAASYTLLETQSIDLVSGFVSTATCRGYNKAVTELVFTGSELFAGGVGLI